MSQGGWVGDPCDFSVSLSPFGSDFGTLDFGLWYFGLGLDNKMSFYCLGSQITSEQKHSALSGFLWGFHKSLPEPPEPVCPEPGDLQPALLADLGTLPPPRPAPVSPHWPVDPGGGRLQDCPRHSGWVWHVTTTTTTAVTTFTLMQWKARKGAMRGFG